MAPATFVHSPDPRPIAGDSPLVAATQRFTLAEEQYLHKFWPMTSTMSHPPPAPFHPIPAAPQQRLIYMPTWSAAQSGPLPLMPPTHAAPVATPVAPPMAPPQHFGYPPGIWGQMPNYYPAPAQPYLIGYPPGPWQPYQQYYTGHPSHGDEDSETAKPDKFTGREPSKLRPFIVSCVMAVFQEFDLVRFNVSSLLVIYAQIYKGYTHILLEEKH